MAGQLRWPECESGSLPWPEQCGGACAPALQCILHRPSRLLVGVTHQRAVNDGGLLLRPSQAAADSKAAPPAERHIFKAPGSEATARGVGVGVWEFPGPSSPL